MLFVLKTGPKACNFFTSVDIFTQDSSAPTDGGFFNGANRFSIDQPTMIETQINLSPASGTPSIAFILGAPSDIQIRYTGNSG
jgi:hypothetical protein